MAMAAIDPATDPGLSPAKSDRRQLPHPPGRLLLSESTARALGVKPGDELLLLTQTPTVPEQDQPGGRGLVKRKDLHLH